MALLDSVESYIWGRVDEADFIRRVVEDEHTDLDALLAKVQAIQSTLNVKLRQGVEANYPRLLEQVSAIESLSRLQLEFDHEMRTVNDKAEEISRIYETNCAQLRADTAAWERLVEVSRVLGDAMRCKELVNRWHAESDLLARAEALAELQVLCAENAVAFNAVEWMKRGFVATLPELHARTCEDALGELRAALLTLNATYVRACLTTLSLLFNVDGCAQRIKALMDEATADLDRVLLDISVARSSDKAARHLPMLANKLHTYLEQYQLLGIENAQKFANQTATVLRQRIPEDANYAMRLVQTISKCLQPHADAVTKPIRDALSPVKTKIMSQALARLFALVDDTFTHDDRKPLVIVEKVSAALKAELSNVDWDPERQKHIEENIAKMIGNKVESGLVFKAETLQLSGRVSAAQRSNYQLLSVAHTFRKQWPLYSDFLGTVIEPHLDVIIDEMRKTVRVVLDSMHVELEQSDTSGGGGASTSAFMGELCGHLRVFRTHVVAVEPLAESLEALPNFLNYIIEQFLLHASLVRPLSADVAERFSRDLRLLGKTLQTFNCKTAKYLNAHAQFADWLAAAPAAAADDAPAATGGVPHWLQLHALISLSPPMPLPHESADWQRAEYMDWFNAHAAAERCAYLRNLVASFEHSAAHDAAMRARLARLHALLDEYARQQR